MSTKQSKQIRRVYGVILSISILIAGLCLMAACFSIYRSGDHPFSREAVAGVFQHIRVPVYLCLTLAILGFPLNWWLPKEEKKVRPGKQDALILQRLHSKTNLDLCSDALRNAVAAQQKSRALHSAVRSGLLALTCIVFLAYVFSGDRFQLPDINSSMLRAMGVLLPCLAVTFAYAVFAAYHNRVSMKKEIELLKQAQAEAPGAVKPRPEATDTLKQLNLLQGAVVLAALILLFYGFFTGGTVDVLTKAINICTECVGLG